MSKNNEKWKENEFETKLKKEFLFLAVYFIYYNKWHPFGNLSCYSGKNLPSYVLT